MKKIFEKDRKYYRLDIPRGTLYFSYSPSDKVSQVDYIDLTLKSIVFKVDELVQKVNELEKLLEAQKNQKKSQ